MANQQQRVELPSAVVVNDHMYPRPLLPLWVKNDIGTRIHSLYTTALGSFLFHLLLHPYLRSFDEKIFILVPLIFLLDVAKLERQGAPKMHTLPCFGSRFAF